MPFWGGKLRTKGGLGKSRKMNQVINIKQRNIYPYLLFLDRLEYTIVYSNYKPLRSRKSPVSDSQGVLGHCLQSSGPARELYHRRVRSTYLCLVSWPFSNYLRRIDVKLYDQVHTSCVVWMFFGT